MEFRFELGNAGWASADISHGDTSVHLTASYLSDALGNLLSAVADLSDGAFEAGCTWDEEPGEFRWAFNVDSGGATVTITTFDFDEVWADDQLIFSATVPLDELARAVVEGAEATLEEHGEAGYLRRWVLFSFPTQQLARLRSRLEASST